MNAYLAQSVLVLVMCKGQTPDLTVAGLSHYPNFSSSLDNLEERSVSLGLALL